MPLTDTAIRNAKSAEWGLWSIGGDYSDDMKQSYEQSETKNLKLAFDVLRVSVDLPWMDAGVFRSRVWDWSGGSTYSGQLISNGADYAKGKMPDAKSLIPFIPTGILIARNVELAADWTFNIDQMFERVRKGGGSIGYGPIRLGGRSSKSEKDTYKLAQSKGNKITFPDPQVIGYLRKFCRNRRIEIRLESGPTRMASTLWNSAHPLNRIPRIYE